MSRFERYDKQSWYSGNQTCKESGMEMVIIENDESERELLEYLRNTSKT